MRDYNHKNALMLYNSRNILVMTIFILVERSAGGHTIKLILEHNIGEHLYIGLHDPSHYIITDKYRSSYIREPHCILPPWLEKCMLDGAFYFSLV